MYRHTFCPFGKLPLPQHSYSKQNVRLIYMVHLDYYHRIDFIFMDKLLKHSVDDNYITDLRSTDC